MSGQVSAVAFSCSLENGQLEHDITRRSAQFQPSVWGDYFLSFDSHTPEAAYMLEKHIEELKERVKSLLISPTENPTEKLRLIDSIQRLGISYHFETEIDKILENIHKNCRDTDEDDEDLYTTALRFRLFRQQGYKTSCDAFNKFKDSNGNFKRLLEGDVQGLLSLYEASHLRVRGEDILDEAFAFTTARFEAILTNSTTNSAIADEICYALKWPIYKNLPRLDTRQYISLYNENPSRNDTLLSFAKLDFNELQKLYQKEIASISRWWEDYGFAEKLSFARNRIVEGYFFALGIFYEPQFSMGRIIMTKIIAIGSMLDDIYDAYGTFEELKLLTNALERWDRNKTDQLPEYMKLYYEALLDVFDEIEQDMREEKGISYCMHHMKETTKELGRVFLIEAKWCNEGYTPTVKEYLDIALTSFGHKLLIVTSFLGMGDIATKKAVEWAVSMPKIVNASTVICRLMNDMVSHEFEKERGHVASSIECYMKENSVSEEEARINLHELIGDSWKDIVENDFKPTKVSKALSMRVVNLTRLFNVIYKDGDGYTQSKGTTKALIKSLLVDPVPI